MILVEYSSNNSGGGWWLTDEDWLALEAAGWSVQWMKDSKGQFTKPDADGRWLGALATEASKEFSSMREAVEEWERTTGQSASDLGCFTCCGQPHNFSGEDTETGAYVSGPEIVVETRLEW